ncbi:MAG: hypothetical protein ABW217_06050 [Polyangiaceae bacterium]
MSRRALTLAALLASSAVVAACVQERPPSVRAAPGALVPSAALPDSADLVLRLDLERLRGELGPELLRRVLVATLVSEADAPANTLLAAAVDRADLGWLGFELGSSLASSSKVLVLRGHFASLDPGARWSPLSADQGSLEAFDADVPDSPGGFTRAYRLEDELVVLAPRAQAGAIERRLAGAGREGLHPPDRGVLSLAVRPEAFVASYLGRYPTLGGYLSAARAARAYADPDSSGLRALVELDFASNEAAAEASEVFAQLLSGIGAKGCAFGDLARVTKATHNELTVSLEARVERASVGALYGCVLNGACCPEPAAPVSSATTPAPP